MIGNYQICLSRHFSGITHLTTEVIIHLTGIITGSYKQIQENDYTACLAGYTILSKRDNHGNAVASRQHYGEAVPSVRFWAQAHHNPRSIGSTKIRTSSIFALHQLRR